MKEQILIDALENAAWDYTNEKVGYLCANPKLCAPVEEWHKVYEAFLSGSNFHSTGKEKGVSYPISKRACYSCGEYFNPDTEFGVSVFDGDRKYFYCEKCSGKNEHTKPRV